MSAQDHKASLFAAGRRLAERAPAPDAAAICLEAGLPPATLVETFGGLEQYLTEVQLEFMNQLRAEIIAATQDMEPGFARAKSGAQAYLDGCLGRRGLRGWLMAARRQKGSVAEGLRKQNGTYRLILPGEFAAMGWPHPQAGARLFLALLMEAARSEHEFGKPDPELRAGIWHFLRTYAGKTAG